MIYGETEASRKSNNSFDDIDSNGKANDDNDFSQQSQKRIDTGYMCFDSDKNSQLNTFSNSMLGSAR